MPRPFTRSQVPKPNNVGNVTERLPAEILALICQALEEPPPNGRGLILKKHSKIKSVLQIKNTCKAWYLRIVTARLLFREIAFDTMNVSTVETAQVCLRLLGQESKIPLHVFIAGSEGDMDQFTRLREKIIKLLQRLSGFAPNIARCEVWDPSDKMCDFLKGHASTLGYLSIGVTGKTSVFSGPLPSLHTIVIKTSNSKLWHAFAFPLLSNLTLSYVGGSPGASLRALIELLATLPRLQCLHLENFGRWLPGRKFLPELGLASTTLHDLSFTNCDFLPVLQYLRVQNLRSFLVHGDLPNNSTPPLPFFRNPLLWHTETPIFTTRGLCHIIVIVRQELTERSLIIEAFGNGLRFLLRFQWFRWSQGGWESWVTRTWGNLLRRLRLSSNISFTINLDEPSVAAFSRTFLSHPCVGTLAIAGGSLSRVLQHLGDLERVSYRLRFPALKVLDLRTHGYLTIQEGNLIRSYMQFRASVGAPVRAVIRCSAWREAQQYPWTTFMIAYSTHSATSLVFR